MATAAEIDAALLTLRTARIKFANTGDERARAILARDTATAAVQDVNARFVVDRDAAVAAKQALLALLQTPET